MKKGFILMTILALIGSTLTGCGGFYEKKLATSSDDTLIMPTIESNEDESGNNANENNQVIYEMGDSISVSNPNITEGDATGLIYRFLKVKYYEHALDAITMDTFIDSDVLNDVSTDFPFLEVDPANYGLVMFDVEIENVNEDEEYNITAMQLAYVNSENNEVHFTGFPCYSTENHETGNQGTEYHCNIKKGEKKTLQIGFLVDLSQYELSSLYGFLRNADMEKGNGQMDDRYIALHLEDSKE